jgi:hypothetical protein
LLGRVDAYRRGHDGCSNTLLGRNGLEEWKLNRNLGYAIGHRVSSNILATFVSCLMVICGADNLRQLLTKPISGAKGALAMSDVRCIEKGDGHQSGDYV